MKKLFLLCFLLSLILFREGYCQERVIDSLQQRLKNAKDDKARIHALVDLGQHDYNDTARTLTNLKEAYSLSKQTNFNAGLVRTIIGLVGYYIYSGEYEKIQDLLTEASKVPTTDLKPSLIFKLKLVTGNFCFTQAKYKDAVKVYTEALSIAEKLNDAENIVATLTNLSISVREMEQYREALKYILRTLEYIQKIEDKEVVANVYSGIAGAYYELGITDSVPGYYFKELDLRKRLGNKESLAKVYANIGIYYEDVKEYDKALEYSLMGLEVRKDIGNLLGLSNSYMVIGIIDMKLKKYETAIETLKKSLDLAKKAGAALQLEDTYYYLSYTYGSKGDWEHAYEYHVQYAKMRDSILNKDSRDQIIEMQTKYDAEKKEKENSELKRKGEIQQLEIRNESEKRRSQLTLSVVLLGLILISSFFVYNRFKLKQKALHAAELSEEKEKGLKAIIDAEEKERARIAKDLHDGIVQDLTVIKLKLNDEASKRGGNGDENLKETIENVDRAAKEVREIAYQMMPVVLKEYGLIKALEDLLQKSLSPREIKYEFEALNVDSRLSEKIEVTLYRITQELLNNVIKHSSANFVSLVLSRRPGSMVMIFEDNGKGFDPDKVTRGLGMNSLTSRLQMVHGDLHFEPGASSGTVATIKIPLS